VTTKPPLYPVVLRLEGLACLVVGGGRVAARKATSLVECAARVTVIAPELCEEIERLPLRVLRRAYEPGDATRYRLVITATGISAIDRAVFEDGESAGVMVNAADNVESCRFFLPAVVRRGPVLLTASTSGTSPFLASWLRRRLFDVVGPEFAQVALLLGEARQALKAAGRSTEGADWDSLLDDDLVSDLAAGRSAHVQARVDEWVADELGRGAPA
jgi:precorrin-2 dehydrogenase/sirohydrochlorin ferrochelatase